MQLQAKCRGGIYMWSGVHSCLGGGTGSSLDEGVQYRPGVIPNASGPRTLFCDNTGAIALAKEPRFHRKTRHIKHRVNSIRESVQNGDIDICKVHTDLNVADPLTKSKTWSTPELYGCSIHHNVTRLLTLVQVGDWWKYSLEAIIKWLLLYFLVHDNCLLFML